MTMTARQPRTLGQLLDWFLGAWADEMPARVHVRGVWHDPSGGSALGSPAQSSAMRRFVEGSPHATDYDPRLDTWHGNDALLTPIRSALADLRRDNPFMAQYLWQVGCAGDWNPIEAWVPAQYREIYVHEALRRLHRIWWQKEAAAA